MLALAALHARPWGRYDRAAGAIPALFAELGLLRWEVTVISRAGKHGILFTAEGKAKDPPIAGRAAALAARTGFVLTAVLRGTGGAGIKGGGGPMPSPVRPDVAAK